MTKLDQQRLVQTNIANEPKQIDLNHEPHVKTQINSRKEQLKITEELKQTPTEQLHKEVNSSQGIVQTVSSVLKPTPSSINTNLTGMTQPLTRPISKTPLNDPSPEYQKPPFQKSIPNHYGLPFQSFDEYMKMMTQAIQNSMGNEKMGFSQNINSGGITPTFPLYLPRDEQNIPQETPPTMGGKMSSFRSVHESGNPLRPSDLSRPIQPIAQYGNIPGIMSSGQVIKCEPKDSEVNPVFSPQKQRSNLNTIVQIPICGQKVHEIHGKRMNPESSSYILKNETFHAVVKKANEYIKSNKNEDMLDEMKDLNILHLLDDVCSYFQVKWCKVKKKCHGMKFEFYVTFTSRRLL